LLAAVKRCERYNFNAGYLLSVLEESLLSNKSCDDDEFFSPDNSYELQMLLSVSLAVACRVA